MRSLIELGTIVETVYAKTGKYLSIRARLSSSPTSLMLMTDSNMGIYGRLSNYADFVFTIVSKKQNTSVSYILVLILALCETPRVHQLFVALVVGFDGKSVDSL